MPRLHLDVARAALLAAALASLGVAIPLALMVRGATAGAEYHAWTWVALPAVWLGALGAARLATARPAPGGLLLALVAAAGMWAFRPELGLVTFGAVWLLGAWIYLGAAPRTRASAEGAR